MFSIEIYGQTYRFLSTEEFAPIIGRSVSALEKDTRHPARIKDRGRVLWCPELYALHILPDNVATKKVIPDTNRRLTTADFEPHLKAVGGR